MRYPFIDRERRSYPVTVLCRVLEVSTSGFYAWLLRPKCGRAMENEQLAVAIAASHERSRRTYGSPRVTADLRAEGRRVGRNRVARIMREKGVRARIRRRFKVTTDSRHDRPIAPNRLERRFHADAPGAAWVSDVKAIWTSEEGWLYLAPVIDLFSRRVLGWSTSASNDATLVLEALDAAVRARRPCEGLLHHSDRGSPYASDDFRARLIELGAVASMSRKGDCWDNAVAESFFSTLVFELLAQRRFSTHAQARAALAEWIDGIYNLTRRHSTLGYLSPIEFELRHAAGRHAAKSTCPPNRGKLNLLLPND
jgi:putative transposase